MFQILWKLLTKKSTTHGHKNTLSNIVTSWAAHHSKKLKVTTWHLVPVVTQALGTLLATWSSWHMIHMALGHPCTWLTWHLVHLALDYSAVSLSHYCLAIKEYLLVIGKTFVGCGWYWPPSPLWKWRRSYLVSRVVPHLRGERGWVSCHSSGSLEDFIQLQGLL